MKKALLVAGGMATAASTASATLVTDATTEIAGMVTDATTVAAACLGIAAIMGLYGLVKGFLRRH